MLFYSLFIDRSNLFPDLAGGGALAEDVEAGAGHRGHLTAVGGEDGRGCRLRVGEGSADAHFGVGVDHIEGDETLILPDVDQHERGLQT